MPVEGPARDGAVPVAGRDDSEDQCTANPSSSRIFLIFTGAAIIAGLALFARQSMLVAYIALGVLVGPWGLGLIEDATTAQGIGEVGIIFLLYLLGLNLHPQKLARMMREGDGGHPRELPRVRGGGRGGSPRVRLLPARGAGGRRGLDVLQHESSG